MDEPTLGLDIQTRIRIWDYIKDINQQGTTIFLTTHYMDEADQLSDRISIMDHGKIIVAGQAMGVIKCAWRGPYILRN
jgi:ABC-2 type transport system ATP-binding protein